MIRIRIWSKVLYIWFIINKKIIMRIKFTILIIGLTLGLLSCSRNSGVLENVKSVQKNVFKSSAVSDSTQGIHMLTRGVNSAKFDSAGGTLTTIVLVRHGNVNLGPGTNGNTITEAKHDTIWNQTEQFDDLLNMATGMMGDLVFLDIPPGVYDKAIVTVTNGWAAKDGVVYPVKFPGDHMTLAFKPGVTVSSHVSLDLVFNIDVNASFVKTGNSFIFKPIVKVVNATSTGSLTGWVKDSSGNPIPGAFVYVIVNGLPYGVSTFDQIYVDPVGKVYYPGQYWLPFIPGGTYTAYATANGYNTVPAQVSILNGNYNPQNFTLAHQ